MFKLPKLFFLTELEILLGYVPKNTVLSLINGPTDTTALSYWLNWRFFFCALWIFISMILASYLIFKYEGFNKERSSERDENHQEEDGLLYEDEAWNTCVKGIDPIWLLVYRIISFVILLALIIANVAVSGASILAYYTQLTFTLVTIYFGLGSSFSIYGCLLKHNEFGARTVNGASIDAESTYMAPSLEGVLDIPLLPKCPNQEFHTREIAGVWGYIFQIIYQTCAGAVFLTDFVFWFVLYPVRAFNNDKLDFLNFCMHTINAVFLLGDTSLNCMRFPVFRFAYFLIWTAAFVISQWIIHACVSIWWPYPFLDLSSPYAPLWYLGVNLMHFPCYGLFILIVKLKHFWLNRSFPGSSRIVH
ncbi:hypothetical protein MtrunA17_Chr8g0368481 [Medicago truncatula]|uniref:Transmembrane protein, putative n=1 Tax=Medicago truncatula TaxID=3880 RepID=A0A072TSM2_MEDTR|nr:uncharacterized protein LOC25501487 [Medicago truncatula]KEH20206.1 transmembrane protein, putative [Medicago truncatula]RHN41666.1 hypothetical protein MtrunA17_Chr8g0368481 [Medicago truncatula]